jgi:hypothetical protein
MSNKRSHSDIITYNVKGLSLEQVDMGTLPNDEEGRTDEQIIRDLKRPRLMTYYGDESDLELEKNICQNCSIL